MGTLKRGLFAGFRTTWTLSKVIFPITLFVVLLQHTPVLPWIMNFITPFMQFFGLRGDAAIPLVLGNMLNLYAAIGGILSLDLTVKEVFIIAVMLSFSHNLFIETAVALKVGVKLWVVLLVRLGLAALSAFVIHHVWQGGDELAVYGMAPKEVVVTNGWGDVFLLAVQKAGFGVLQLALIVIPLMILIQLLKDRRYLERVSKSMAPVTRFLGIQPNASMTLLSGFVIGLAYGAGVMIQAVKEDGVSKKDATLVFIFLVACHAAIEDTLIFLPLGIPIWPLFLMRLGIAFVLTVIVSFVWKRSETLRRKEVLTS